MLNAVSASCQVNDPLIFQEVVTVDSASKPQLYERGRLWFSDYFKSSKAVLEVNDKESGEFIGKPILYTWYNSRYFGKDHKVELTMPVTIRLRVKDGKYKYEVYDITTYYDAPGSPYGKGTANEMFGPLTTSETCPKSYSMAKQAKVNEDWNEAKHNAAVVVEELATSLKTYMNKKRDKNNDDF